MNMPFRSLVPAVALGASGIALWSAPARAQLGPSVEFRVPKAPTVAAFDSGAFLVYELHVTNLTPNGVRLAGVDVLDASGNDRALLSLRDSALAKSLGRPGTTLPLAERPLIAGGMRAAVFLWVPVDKANPPAMVRHRLTVQSPGTDATLQTLEGAVASVDRDIAVIAPPLRGEWLAANGPSNASGHRRSAIAFNGVVAIGQRFAIDFVQVDERGSTFKGDSLKNESYYAEGNVALAVADGIVVETKDSIPENVPGGRAVPITLVTVGGNHIVIDIGHGRYAFYAHLKPGSLRVHSGDRVTRGQVIGLVGNTGNSTEPHLHFHLSDALAAGTSTLGSEGVPYAVERLEVVGGCAGLAAGTCTRHAPVVAPRAMPMQNELVRFPK